MCQYCAAVALCSTSLGGAPSGMGAVSWLSKCGGRASRPATALLNGMERFRSDLDRDLTDQLDSHVPGHFACIMVPNNLPKTLSCTVVWSAGAGRCCRLTCLPALAYLATKGCTTSHNT